MRVAVITPVYNEEAIIERSVETMLQYVRGLPCPASLIAVNDGSRDRTGAILSALDARYPDDVFRAVSYPVNRGYGGALKAGAACALNQGYDYLVFMDCDLTDHPRYLTMMVEKMRDGWEYIKTTRHVPEGGYQAVPWKRRFISQVGCAVARGVTGLPLSDLANGFRAIRSDIFQKLELHQNDFSIIMEELAQVKRVTHRICEIPRVQGIRSTDARPSTFTYDAKTLWSYFKFLIPRP